MNLKNIQRVTGALLIVLAGFGIAATIVSLYVISEIGG